MVSTGSGSVVAAGSSLIVAFLALAENMRHGFGKLLFDGTSFAVVADVLSKVGGFENIGVG